MEWLASLMGGSAKGVLEGIGGLATSIRTAITGEAPITAEQRTQIELQLAAMEAAAQKAAADFDMAQMQGQVELDKIEAQSPSLFKSGWRPGVGWICAFALGYQFLVRPILPWVVATCGWQVAPMPPLEMEGLNYILGGILGLGGMRTFERIKGPGK